MALSQEDREAIHSCMRRTVEQPSTMEIALSRGPESLYEGLINPNNIPNDLECQRLAQAMRENREETMQIIAAVLGFA